MDTAANSTAVTSYEGDLRELVTDAYAPLGRHPVYTYCPAHQDVLRPSLAVYADHAFCYTCRTRYSRAQFSALFDDAARVRAAIFRRTHTHLAAPRQHVNVPLLVETAHHALANTTQYIHQLEWLYARGIDINMISYYRLGYTGSAYTLPYWDKNDKQQLVRFRRDDTLLGASKTLPKYWGIAGYNQTALFPRPLKGDKRIVLTEGEFDAMLVRRLWSFELGRNVFSFTNGAQALPNDKELKEMLGGIERVVMLRDQDTAGRAGTEKLLVALHRVFPSIQTLDMTWDIEETGGKDITEVWQHNHLTAAALAKQAAQALN